MVKMIIMPASFSRLTKLCRFFLLFLFMLSESALALDLDVRSNRSSRLDFSLVIDHASADVESDSADLEINLERLGIVSIEVPPDGPQFGLLLGYAYADFSSNPSVETLKMDGYYIGVSVRGYLVKQQNLSLSLSSYYLYQSVDGRDDQATASLSWDELSADLSLQYRTGSFGILQVGYNTAVIDARYRYNGVSNSSDDLDNRNRHGVVIGFSYQIDRLETVGIRYQRSAIEGVALEFRKIF